MQMACPEACFQANTAADCFDQIQRWIAAEHHGATIYVLTALEMLLQPSITPLNQRILGYLGPLNLFVLTSGMLVSTPSFEQSLTTPKHFTL